jgi:hypothetical protein
MNATLVPETLPVSFTAPTGWMTRRVYTSECGVAKFSRPSRKKGRFSGKNRAERGSKLNCPASDSICEKSGLTVPFRVRLLVIPHRTLPPSSGRPDA